MNSSRLDVPRRGPPARGRRALLVLAATQVAALMLAPDASAARSRRRRGMSEEAKLDYKANDMLNRGLELLQMNQEERGLKLVASVPRLFPQSVVRFRARLALGSYYMGKRQYDLAIKQFRELDESEEEDQRAEGLYQTGVCHYSMNDFDKAFMSLRKVTNQFPWSVYANESYYYIGQCHFKLGRWAKAVEALEMVGTSVPTSVEGAVAAEAGQRLFVKAYDKDLVVLMAAGERLAATVSAASGDREAIDLEPLGRGGEYFIGSVQTAPGEAKRGDGVLQIVGGDKVEVTYVDVNTESGQRNKRKLAAVRMVSTASVGFTDGAYREYTKGVFGDTDAFVRVKDLDCDRTRERDAIRVTVKTQYKVQAEGRDASMPGEIEEETEFRDSLEVELRETGPHTGIFVGTVLPKAVDDPKDVSQGDDTLSAAQGDEIVVEYLDEAYLAGEGSRDVTATARLLIGQIRDVRIEHRQVSSPDLKARKDLIEAKIYLKLGVIFKDVGLVKKAHDKAAQGLERVEDVIRSSLRTSLERETVEEAFSVKWDLLLVQDRLNEAINVCRTLMQLYPDSSMVDRALLKIGIARSEGPNPWEAIGIFNAIIGLKESDLKAEAQYRIGEVLERQAVERARRGDRPPDLTPAMKAYKQCSESYPDSSFAGDALDKIADYYITVKDYSRATELMERIFQDYPDASFLDKMLLKWVIAAYRMQNYALAAEKVNQFLAEYPNSKLADKARKFQSVIERKLGR